MTTDVMVSYGIYGVVAALAVLGALLGGARGVMRQLTRMVTVGASLVIAFPITLALKDTLVNAFAGQSLADILATAGVPVSPSDWYGAVSAETITTVMALPAAIIILPLTFVVVFMVVSFFMLLFHKIICGIVGFTRLNNDFVTRFLGIFAGAMQGAAVALVLLIPVAGTINCVSAAVSYVEQKYPEKTNSQALVANYNFYLNSILI